MSRCLTMILLFTACATGAPIVPLLPKAQEQPVITLVWVGRGEAELFEDGSWRRTPAFDYEFTVEQRRFATHWESVKQLRRRHPGYDGSAGPREQTMFFRIDYALGEGNQVTSKITSTLGEGTGHADLEFRTARLTMRPEVSRFAPFDTYRIDQTYRYEEGALEEEVALLNGDRPWVRNHEQATLFAPHQFAEAPTRLMR